MQTKFAAEAGRFTSPRISVLSGGNRLRWLLGDALTTVVGGRGPLVIIPGRQMERFGWLLARFGVLSDPLVAPTMSDLVSGLQYAAKYGEECF
jgi:hypothetical protein